MAGDAIFGLDRLRNRAQYKAVARSGHSAGRLCVVVAIRLWRCEAAPDGLGGGGRKQKTQVIWRYGLTVSRRVGSSVIRNRARRRLRELAREIIPLAAPDGCDIVLIARQRVATAHTGALREQLLSALRSLSREVRAREVRAREVRADAKPRNAGRGTNR